MLWRRSALVLAWFTTATALVVLTVGWWLGVEAARTVLPGLVDMAPLTAVALAAAGTALPLLLGGARRRIAGRLLAGLVLLIALLVLAEYLLDRSFGIDELLFREQLERIGRERPGRPSPNAAFALALTGLALLLAGGRTRALRRTCSGLALASGVIALHALIGYAFDIESLYRISFFNPIALHTAFALLLLSLAIMCAQPEHGLVRLLANDGATGYITRRLLPVAVLAPIAIGYLELHAERYYGLGSELGTTLVVVLGIMVTTTAVWLSALALETEERRRHVVARERERLLRELQLERTRLRDLFEQVPVAVSLVSGPEFVFELANPEYQRLSGREQLLGRRFLEVFPETPPEAPVLQVLQRVYETGQTFTADAYPVQIDRGKGREDCFFLFTTQAVRDRAGRISGLLTVAVDVTSRVEAEHERERLLQAEREARAAAEIANHAKSQFLSHMSHELRTPLNAILGYAELLQAGLAAPLGERATSFVDRIRLAAEHQKQLIEDVLTFSRIQAGREEVQLARISVADLLREIGAVISPLAERKQLELCTGGEGGPETITTDPRKLRQILLNLLGNAVKFTDRGRVSLAVSAAGGRVTFTVSDTGIGIRPEHYEQLFEPFWQVDGSLTRTAEGSGLGLTIARRMARMLGGEIEVRSTPGEGSDFLLVLPEEPAPARPAEPTL